MIFLALLTALMGISGPSAQAAASPRLTAKRPCPHQPGFTCAALTVPLDHALEAKGTLRLEVGLANTAHAPRGVLVFLTGGPGQPGVPFLTRIRELLGPAFAGYRLVMLDQRGTGAGALNCPALQKAVGSSDLAVAPPGTVAACARSIGAKRRFFTNPETVADIESLRIALGARRLTLDGVSYGTFVAERYALVHPNRVARLVLDSVVPQEGIDLVPLTTFRATTRVLRSVCAAERCGSDPARDLQAVRAHHDGPQLVDAITSMSIGHATFSGLLPALHAARAGHYAALDAIVRVEEKASAATATELSQGLHESTLCMDLPPPYDPTAPRAQRAAVLGRLVSRVPSAALFPFDRATAHGLGDTENCLEWPATVPPAVPAGRAAAMLPRVPVLLLAGNRDISTPLAWAREEAAKAPDGRLVVISGVGHSVQTTKGPAIRPLLRRFLHSV